MSIDGLSGSPSLITSVPEYSILYQTSQPLL